MAQAISKPMLGLLIATVVLTAVSYAIREWRESSAMPAVIEGAEPAHAAQNSGVSTESTPSATPGRGVDGPRQPWPAAAIDAMSSRRPPPVPVENQAQIPVAPPPPPLPPPNFQLIGRYADGKIRYVFFVQGDKLIPAKVGQMIVDGFVLQSLRAEKATIVRKADGQKFEMTLEAQ